MRVNLCNAKVAQYSDSRYHNAVTYVDGISYHVTFATTGGGLYGKLRESTWGLIITFPDASLIAERGRTAELGGGLQQTEAVRSSQPLSIERGTLPKCLHSPNLQNPQRSCTNCVAAGVTVCQLGLSVLCLRQRGVAKSDSVSRRCWMKTNGPTGSKLSSKETFSQTCQSCKTSLSGFR